MQSAPKPTLLSVTLIIPKSGKLCDLLENLRSLYEVSLPPFEEMHTVIRGRFFSYEDSLKESLKNCWSPQIGLVWPQQLVISVGLFLPV